jgi:predicted ribosome quality control (RQC) complex YloA/Tae2 family protein
MQRKLSSFDIYVIASEFQNLMGCHIEKIYQLSRSEVLIKVKNVQTKQKESIYIRNGELICTTQKQLETPTKPSTFAMTLRKYLLNGRITGVSQHEFDRILKLKIGKKEGDYTIVVEFFSDGNIILVDPDDKIILPFIRQSWAHRKVKGREAYTPPPSQINPFDLNKERFAELLRESNADLVRTLAVSINLSGPIAEEICNRAGVDKKTKIENIDDGTITKTFDALILFLEVFKKGKFEPVVVKKENMVVDVLPFKFDSYQDVVFEKVDSLSRRFEEFIGEKKVKEKKKESKIEKLVGKLNRQLAQQEESVKKFEKEIGVKKIEGDLIYLNYQEIENLLREITKVLELKEKTSEIERINQIEIVDKFDPTDNMLVVNLKDASGSIFKVRLNFRKTVSENAEKCYDDNKKLRSKLHGAEKAIHITKEHLEQAKKKEQVEREEQEKIKPVKKEKQFWFERYRWFISSEGNLVVGGRDAKSNDLIVKKYLKEGDRYAHADIQGAPSIIIKSKDVSSKPIPISEQTLSEACIFAASFSKAWKQFAEAQAYWVLPEQVSKTARSGEFVPRGGFIIRGKRNYYRCKLEVAVGLVNIEDTMKVMCGPVDAVEKHTDRYVVLVPGGMKKNDIAHKLGKAFDIGVDNVDRALPPGGVTVVKSVGVEL